MNEPPSDKDCRLETGRLLLSPMVATDADLLFELLRNPALYAFTGGSPLSSVEELRERIHRWEPRRSPTGDEVWLNWTVRLKSGGTALGYLQSTIRADRAELAWVIGLPFQRRGYATEAALKIADWLKDRFEISEFRANIHAQHVASREVAKRVGLSPSSETTGEGEEVWTLRCRRTS